MKKLNLVILSVLSLLVFQSCDNNDENLCLVGNGNVMSYELEFSDFKSVSLSGPINLSINQGSDQSVVVLAEPELFSPLEYRKSGELLEVGYAGNVSCFDTDFGVWVNITVPNIEEVFISGQSNIISDGPLSLASITFDVSGQADIQLEGTAGSQLIKSSGSINVDNFDFQTDRTTVDISGEGDLELHCEQELNINVSGAATIRYKGNPTISQNVSGSLNLVDAN